MRALISTIGSRGYVQPYVNLAQDLLAAGHEVRIASTPTTVRGLVEEAYPEVVEACRRVDMVITSHSSAGAAEAQRLGVPWISVTLQPARLPTERGQRGPVRRSFERVVGRALVAPTNRFRARVGALAPTKPASML